MDAVVLDTDVFSYVWKRHKDAALYDRHLAGKQQTISFTTVGELLEGAVLGGWDEVKTARLESAIHAVTVIPYDHEVCRVWASLCLLKTPSGSPRNVAVKDRWIAACAIRHNLPLISHNRRHFQDIPGLTLSSEAPPT
jgi:tRNA(fMet)-specific endonuclease VapC